MIDPSLDLAVGVFVFDGKCMGQMDADTVRDIGLAQRRDARDVLLQWRDQFAGEDGVSIAI